MASNQETKRCAQCNGRGQTMQPVAGYPKSNPLRTMQDCPGCNGVGDVPA